MIWLIFAGAFWLAAWRLNVFLSHSPWRGTWAVRLAVPAIFGLTLLIVWEALVRGLGARLLAGSYYGQTVQIWSALIAAAILAAILVGLIGLAQRITLRRMGMAR